MDNSRLLMLKLMHCFLRLLMVNVRLLIARVMDKRTKFEEHERKESPNTSVCVSCHNLIFYFLVEKIYRVEHWNCNVTLIQVCNTGVALVLIH